MSNVSGMAERQGNLIVTWQNDCYCFLCPPWPFAHIFLTNFAPSMKLNLLITVSGEPIERILVLKLQISHSVSVLYDDGIKKFPINLEKCFQLFVFDLFSYTNNIRTKA